METTQAPEAPPTVTQVAEQVMEDQIVQHHGRVNVFTECIQNDVVMVTTEAQASEIARLITRAEADLEAVKATASAMVKRAEQRLSNLEFVFMTPLAIWTRARLVGQKKRSLILEGGQLALRKVPRSVRTEDPAALLTFCQANLPAAIEMVPKVKTDEVKAWEEKTEQVAAGRVVSPESESFKVSIPK